MKKKITLLKVFMTLCLLLVGIANAWGEDETVTFSFTNKDQLQEWTSNPTPSSCETSGSARGLAWSKTAITSFSYTLSDYGVSKVSIVASANDPGYTLFVNGGTGQAVTKSNNTTYDFDIEVAKGGTITISTTKGDNVRSFWIKSITLTKASSTPSDKPYLSVSPTTIDFGTVYQNADVEGKEVTVTFANLTADDVEADMNDVTAFTIDKTGPFTSGDKIKITPIPTYDIRNYEETLRIFSEADELEAIVTIKMKVVEAPAPTGTFNKFTGDLVEGDYIICSGTTAMGNEVSSDRLTYATVTTTDDKIVNPEAALVWHIAPAATEEYWTIYNANVEKYAASTGAKSKIQLMDAANDDKALWTASGSETYEFVNKQNTASEVNANLRYNGGYGFACYANSTGSALTLYQKVLPSPTSISVKTAPTKVTYFVGDKFAPAGLVITANYDSGDTEYIAYEGNESKFTFNPTLETALTTANTSVTITYGGKSVDQAITVNKIATSLQWSAASYEATISEQNEYPTLTTTPSDLSGVTYSSLNPEYATIDATTGEITLVAEGVTTIKASFAENDTYQAATDATYTLTVKPSTDTRKPVNITNVNAEKTTIVKGETTTLTVENNQPDWTPSYIYESDNANVATVADGVITAVGKGVATITVTLNIEETDPSYRKGETPSETIEITVNNPSHTAQFSVNGAIDKDNNVTAEEGDKITFPTNPEEVDGHVFMGWTATPIASTQQTEPTFVNTEEETIGTADITYYAVFAQFNTSTETLVIADYATANNWVNSQAYTYASTANVEFTGAGTVNNCKYYFSDQSWRFYSSGNGAITITAPENITKVELSGESYFTTAPEGWNYNDNVFTPNSETKTKTITIKNGNGISKIKEIEVSYSSFSNYRTFVTQVPVTINDFGELEGNASFCSAFDLDFTGMDADDVEYKIGAYIGRDVVNGETAKLNLVGIDKVPAGTGIFVIGTPGTHLVPIYKGEKALDPRTDNSLDGILGEPYEVKENETIYALSKSDGLLHPVNTGVKIGVGKAYYRLPEDASSVSVLTLAIIDEPTGITSYENENVNDNKSTAVYNLQGMRVITPKKGEIYIMNGKKFLMK